MEKIVKSSETKVMALNAFICMNKSRNHEYYLVLE